MAGLMISGMDALLAAPIATIYAAIIASLVCKFKFNDIVNGAVENVKEMQLVFFILMAAYAMAEAFMATGVGASIINFSLTLGLTARTVAVNRIFSYGSTFSCNWNFMGNFCSLCSNFFMVKPYIGGNILLTTAAIAGGACFGDNIGLISDTTVVSSGIQKVEVIHRIRHQGVWSLICLTITAIIFTQ